MLQHEVMVVDEWHNSGSQDLVTVSLSIQNAINKMDLCSLSITYTCPYHNLTATMGHSIHNIDISKPLTHMTPYTLSAIWWREHLSKVPDAIECEHLPTQVSYDDELQSGRDLDEDDEHADELPWDGFWQFVQKLFGYSNRLLQQLSVWLVSDYHGGEDAECGSPGLVWLHVVCGCEAGRMYCQILRWRWLMVEKWTLNSRATALVDIPVVSMSIARSLKSCNIYGIVLCDKTAHFRVAFYCGQPKAHLCNNHAV